MRYSLNILIVLLFIVTNSFSQNSSFWKPLKTGAGGWATGMDIHPSGTPIYARVDVGSAYRWNETNQRWVNILTSSSMPSTDIYWNNYQGVLSIVSAPSDANRAYMAYGDGIYRSNDQGDSWQRTNFPTINMPANDDASKTSGERIAVDPNDADNVYFGSINDGLWRSTDGGSTWNVVTGISSGTTDRGVRQILFDASSGVTAGITNTIYAFVDGIGIYQSTDAGSTWSLISSYINPIFYDAEMGSSGYVYFCGEDDLDYLVQRFDGMTWANISPDDFTAFGEVAIDPFDADRLLVFSYGFSDTYRTLNATNTSPNWTYMTTSNQANDIGWMNVAELNWFTIGEVVFNPAVPNELWKADGVGTWKTSDLADADVTWTEYAAGQEHLVSNDIVVLSNNRVVTAHWDRPLFYHSDLDAFPATQQPTNRFNSAWDIDRSPSDPDFLVAIIEDHRYCCYDAERRSSGYSTDGGQTWTTFATQPDPIGDNIFGYITVSANDNDNIVWLPSFDLEPYFTTDRGNTWTQATLPNNSGSCCTGANFFDRNSLTADRVLDNTFYIYDFGNGNVYRSTDGGATWNNFNNVLPAFAFNCKIMAVPDHANHLIYARGAEQSISNIHGLMRSVDGGQTWSTFPNTNEVLNVAIGKAAAGSSYPTIYIQGRVNGIFGYFMSTDEGITWNQIGDYPTGIYDKAKIMEADMDEFGRLFVGFAGNGFVYHELIDTTVPNINVSASCIEIYPCPTDDYFVISGLLGNVSINIVNSMGQVVQSLTSSNNEVIIDISNLGTGLYFVNIQDQSNGNMFIETIIKQ